jgi:TetR/AcrR family transcriptional repressor of bet genes
VTPANASRRTAVRPVDKFDRRRDELAESALATLGEMGYARASLREIAGNSPFSHGVVHYYFQDKLELVIYSVRYYKARCVTRYDAVVRDSASPGELVEAFGAKLAQTIREEAPMHRLWYDLRTQSMFESALRDAITEIDATLEAMIWRVVDRFATLSGGTPSVSPAAAYGMLDGLFQQALLAYTAGGEPVLAGLATEVRAVLPLLVR